MNLDQRTILANKEEALVIALNASTLSNFLESEVCYWILFLVTRETHAS
jgi:hypothetical protein